MKEKHWRIEHFSARSPASSSTSQGSVSRAFHPRSSTRFRIKKEIESDAISIWFESSMIGFWSIWFESVLDRKRDWIGKTRIRCGFRVFFFWVQRGWDRERPYVSIYMQSSFDGAECAYTRLKEGVKWNVTIFRWWGQIWFIQWGGLEEVGEERGDSRGVSLAQCNPNGLVECSDHGFSLLKLEILVLISNSPLFKN